MKVLEHFQVHSATAPIVPGEATISAGTIRNEHRHWEKRLENYSAVQWNEDKTNVFIIEVVVKRALLMNIIGVYKGIVSRKRVLQICRVIVCLQWVWHTWLPYSIYSRKVGKFKICCKLVIAKNVQPKKKAETKGNCRLSRSLKDTWKGI